MLFKQKNPLCQFAMKYVSKVMQIFFACHDDIKGVKTTSNDAFEQE